MLHAAVAVSVIIGLISTEFLGVLTGGLVSAGYLAFYLEQPFRVATTLLLAVLVTLLVKGAQNFLILFGRRRFVLTVLLSMLLSSLIEWSFIFLIDLHQDLRIIGYIIPGLIANDMEKQGIVRTLLMVLLSAALIWLVMHLGIL